MLFRPVRLRRRSCDSPRDRAFSELVLVQHLRDFLVVARHPGAALHLLRQKTFQEDSAGNGRGRVVRRRHAEVAHAPALGQKDRLLAKLLSGAGPADSLAGARTRASFALDRP